MPTNLFMLRPSPIYLRTTKTKISKTSKCHCQFTASSFTASLPQMATTTSTSLPLCSIYRICSHALKIPRSSSSKNIICLVHLSKLFSYTNTKRMRVRNSGATSRRFWTGFSSLQWQDSKHRMAIWSNHPLCWLKPCFPSIRMKCTKWQTIYALDRCCRSLISKWTRWMQTSWLSTKVWSKISFNWLVRTHLWWVSCIRSI